LVIRRDRTRQSSGDNDRVDVDVHDWFSHVGALAFFPEDQLVSTLVYLVRKLRDIYRSQSYSSRIRSKVELQVEEVVTLSRIEVWSAVEMWQREGLI